MDASRAPIGSADLGGTLGKCTAQECYSASGSHQDQDLTKTVAASTIGSSSGLSGSSLSFKLGLTCETICKAVAVAVRPGFEFWGG